MKDPGFGWDFFWADGAIGIEVLLELARGMREATAESPARRDRPSLNIR